ncbi:MAG: hypothetical protein K0S47_3547 [Herbinix sp.]|jgi:PmbA protein|nr:hypothetical protein [Herbinix sp.]
MVRELYKEVLNEIALNITGTKIDAVRKKSLTKCGCRAYQDGFIGVAGCYGEPTEETWAKAEESLADQIPYPYESAMQRERVRDQREIHISEEEFIMDMERLLETIRNEFPQYILSNKIQITESIVSLTNDAGLDYINYDKAILMELIVKHVDSINIIDTALIYMSRQYDYDKLLEEARFILEGYEKEVALPEKKKIPVIIQQEIFLSKFQESLNGEAMARGISMFKDRMNSKIFNENFHIYQNRSDDKLLVPFFDMEGTVNDKDEYLLVEDGIIKYTYTDKKNAALHSVPLTGAAGGSYDEVPSLSSPELSIVPGSKTLKQLVQGEQAILAILASGGDFTNTGDFASPVQSAYLMEDGKILGRLPEFIVSGNLYEMFGEDFIGCSSDKALFGFHGAVVRMKATLS